MGYELDRLTRHYGIPNALSSYGGFIAPTGATAEQAAAEATDRAAYKTYTDQVLARIGATPQYEKRQYNKNALANYWATVLQAPTYSDAPATVAPPPVAAPPIPGVPVPGSDYSGSGGGGYGYDAGTPSYDGPGFMSSVANGLGWAVDALDAYGYGKNPPGYQAPVEDRMTGETIAANDALSSFLTANDNFGTSAPSYDNPYGGDVGSTPAGYDNPLGGDVGPAGPVTGPTESLSTRGFTPSPLQDMAYDYGITDPASTGGVTIGGPISSGNAVGTPLGPLGPEVGVVDAPGAIARAQAAAYEQAQQDQRAAEAAAQAQAEAEAAQARAYGQAQQDQRAAEAAAQAQAEAAQARAYGQAQAEAQARAQADAQAQAEAAQARAYGQAQQDQRAAEAAAQAQARAQADAQAQAQAQAQAEAQARAQADAQAQAEAQARAYGQAQQDQRAAEAAAQAAAEAQAPAYTSPVSPGNVVATDLGLLGSIDFGPGETPGSTSFGSDFGPGDFGPGDAGPGDGGGGDGGGGDGGGGDGGGGDGGGGDGGGGDGGGGDGGGGDGGGGDGGGGDGGGWAHGGVVSLANKYKIRDYRHGGFVSLANKYKIRDYRHGGFVSLANKYKIRDYRHGGLVGMEKGYADGGEVVNMMPEEALTSRGLTNTSGQTVRMSPRLLDAIQADAIRHGAINPSIGKFEGADPDKNQSYDFAPSAPAPSAALQNLQQVTAQHSTGDNTAELMRMLASQKSPYADEYKQAKTARSESEMKFQQMLTKAMEQKSDAPSKSEMYFRLAAAFGAPTKTGSFGESLGSAASAMGDYSKEMRIADTANRASRQQLAIMGAQLDLTGKRTEQSELRQLMGADTTSQKALALALLKEQFAAGKPQSEAGKVALDADLTPGTTEYAAFVKEYIKNKLESGDWLKQAMLVVAQGNQATAASREGRAIAAAAKLTPAAFKMKAESQEVLGSLSDAMATMSRAYSMNPNTFEGTWRDTLSRKLLEQTDPKDPRVIAHREQANLLGKGALAKLKATFGGNISDGERAMLLDFEGLDAKSREERAAIMKNAYRLLKMRQVREQKKFDDISSGKYNEVTPEIERD